ncbi:MAG TPA: N-acetylmuramoyl-L-alanine amidase [Chthoniobacterales bacterium]|nr:N-acetylmuramoyl-L-alanine amidase [Chthoniobacterales bacterium]
MRSWLLALLLTPGLAGAAEPAPGETRIVAIDVGHTRASPGAISVTGKPEYEFNLEIAKKLEARLRETGTIKPFLIVSEKPRSLPERTRIAASRNADLFVSIHHDSAQDKYLEERETEDGKTQKYTNKFSGYSVFVSRKNPRYDESLDLARRIGRAMRADFKFATHHNEAIPGENRPIVDREAGVYAFDDLVVLKTASMPAVLVECGVIVNPAEEKLLRTEDRQVVITAALVRGIRDYLGQAPAIPRAEPHVLIETASPAPTRYPKPGTTLPPRDN